MIATKREIDELSLPATVMAAILHYRDRQELLVGRLDATLERFRATGTFSAQEVRKCISDIESLYQEVRDLIIFSQRWSEFYRLRDGMVRNLLELLLIKQTYKAIEKLATS